MNDAGRRNLVIPAPLWSLVPDAIARAVQVEGRRFSRSSYMRRALVNQMRADGLEIPQDLLGAE